MRVLLIDADLVTSRAMVASLKSTGSIVDQIDSGSEGLELLRHYDYDIVLLDLGVSDMDGYELVRRMRASRMETPVLILSGAVRPQARVRAFGIGADDFVTKPFDNAELLARMQAVARRSKGHAQPSVRVGPLELNVESREVRVSGAPVHLTGKEFSILELLIMRKGMVLTKEAFLNHLYGGLDEPEVKIIDVFVCKLRKKLAEAGASNVINTVWGRGYTVRDAAIRPRMAPAVAATASARPHLAAA